jgi:hypothetical protein
MLRPAPVPPPSEDDLAAAAAGDLWARDRVYKQRSRAKKRAAEIAQWDRENHAARLPSPPATDFRDDDTASMDDLPGASYDLSDASGDSCDLSAPTTRYVFLLVVAKCTCAQYPRTHSLA